MGSPTIVAERYRLIERLGQGGMGVVWRAWDEVLHREVAVKEVVPPPGLTPDERQQLSQRTRREARAAARLSHPNVVRVYDVVDGPEAAPWIVMEYVPARSLQQVLAQDGPLPAGRVAAIGLDVLNALRSAHRAGVLHRDVKPGNVLLAHDGRVVLTDFGLATVSGEAAVTRPGLVIGSPGYISPERAHGQPGRPESDLWSLAATLYAALEGRGPFDRDSAMATLTAVANAEPDPTRYAGPLRRLFEGLLRKNPADRIGVVEAERLLRAAAADTGRSVPAQRRPTRVLPAVEDSPPAPAAVSPPPPMAPAPEAPPPVAPAPAAPRTAPARARAPVPPAAAPARRRGRGPLLVALLGLAALALAMFALLPRDSQPQEDGASGAGATSSAATTGAAPAPPAATSGPPTAATGPAATPTGLPAGWRLYRDRTGFTVGVPADWQVSRSGTIVYFREPGGGRTLGIDQTDKPKADPVADWRSQASYRVGRGDFPGYEEIRIEPCKYFLKCADWEFRYTRDSGRVHVNNRGFVVSSDKAYGIWWSTPDSRWTESLPYLQTVFRTFQPAP